MVLTKDQVEATVNSFLKKREESLAWENNLLQLADFAHMLIFKQHAKYSHLRPMYRTVHRRTPRRLVFKAIRWVNPARMYPMAMLTREQIAEMSKEERAEAITQIANYRREAHLIRNRYNEMISLINEGKLPYYIKFAGVKVQSMDQYKERAERLKEGAVGWEHELDVKAVEFREEMGKHDEKFDDVSGLWIDGVPPFFDPKRGKEKKAPMRLLDKEGNRQPIDVFVRDFIDVHPDEIREGEDLWIPKKILMAGEAEAAGAIPVAIPTGFVDHHFSNARNFLEEEGQFQTELPGDRKVRIRNMVIDSAQPGAARREGRATHMDPLRNPDKWARQRKARGQEREAEKVEGRWGRQPHAGGVPGEIGSEQAAAALGGDPEAHEEVSIGRPTPEPFQPALSGMGGAAQQRAAQQVKEREERIRARAKQAGPPDPNEGKPIDQTITALNGDEFNPVENNKNIMEKSAALLDKLGIKKEDQFMYGEQDLSNIDPSRVKFVKYVGSYAGGVLARQNAAAAGKKMGRDFAHGMHVKIDGKDYMYKIIPGEQMAERASFTLDKALGLGVMPYIETANLGVEFMRNAGLRESEVAEWAEMGERGGGFLQEWHEGMVEARGRGHSPNIPGLHSGFGLLAMDLMLGQSDRHNGNFAIHATNGKIVAYDNGANGRFAAIDAENQRGKGLVKWELWRDRDPNPGFGNGTRNTPDLSYGLPTGMDEQVFIGEFDDWFDTHFDMDTILDVGEACNMHVVGELMDGTKVTTEVIKDRMRGYALSRYGFKPLPSWFNPGSSAKVKDKSPSPARSVSADFRDVTPGTPGTAPQQQQKLPAFSEAMSPRSGANQPRQSPNTITGEFREKTPTLEPVQSSMDTRPEFKTIKRMYE